MVDWRIFWKQLRMNERSNAMKTITNVCQLCKRGYIPDPEYLAAKRMCRRCSAEQHSLQQDRINNDPCYYHGKKMPFLRRLSVVLAILLFVVTMAVTFNVDGNLKIILLTLLCIACIKLQDL